MSVKMHWIVVLTTIAGMCFASGCGSSSNQTQENAARYSEGQIVQALGLEPNSVAGYHDSKGCEVAVILNTKAEVDLYSGDTLVTTPDKTAGVKVTDPEGPTILFCMDRFQRELANL